jgi:fructokinase
VGNLFAIGEVLIDFIALQKGVALKDVTSFERVPGGAPANVAATVAKFGGNASLLTKVGEDAFGDFLLDKLTNYGVNTDKILRTNAANTGLAFVALREDGEREFSFYRNPSADLLLSDTEINEMWFNQGDILHFCSVDLVESPMKHAHIKAIQAVKAKSGIVCFDPNVRLPLWSSPRECKNTILNFIPLSHIVKISDEELEFITGIADEEQAIESLFIGDVKVVVFTKGSQGAELYVKNKKYKSMGYCVQVEDTTGAGDAFIGGFLYQLLNKSVMQENLEDVINEYYNEILAFANASGALTTTGKGAISSIPTKEEIDKIIQNSVCH